MTLPVPQSLIQISMFLAGMASMYVSARAVGDNDYRTRFLDPLIDDLRLTLVARRLPLPGRRFLSRHSHWQFRHRRAQCLPCPTCSRSTSGFCIAGCRWC